jgi:hypothetical protein
VDGIEKAGKLLRDQNVARSWRKYIRNAATGIGESYRTLTESNFYREEGTCRAKKQKVSELFPSLYYRLTLHSAVEIGQAALSVEQPTKHVPGQSKGNGKCFPSSMPKLQYANIYCAGDLRRGT